MKLNHALLTIGLLLAASVPGQDVLDLAAECESCHGPRGESREADVPSLAGKGVNYIREMLDQFYNYERHCTTTTYRDGDRAKTPVNMCSMANSLDDADKQALAEYFSNAGGPAAAD
jgi:sulfide dehydrogenase cytochrome subunit